jgi:hypothetical protein
MSQSSPSESLPVDAGLVSTRAPGTPAASPVAEVLVALEMRHPATGDSRLVRVGYSWRVALLGPIELVRRGDWPGVAVSVLLPVGGQLFLAPTANRTYLKLLVRRGYRAVSREPGQIGRVEWALGMLLPRYAGRSVKSKD